MQKVTLLTYTPSPEKIVAAAAKLCYSPSSAETLLDNLTDEKAVGFLEMLAELGHESPLEHVSFTFGIEGVSRALLAQLTRHRIASYSVQSQRYVPKAAFDYIVPPEIATLPEAAEAFTQAMEAARASYERITAMLCAQYTEDGMPEKQAQKKAIEDARFVLPNACDTKMVVTMNARSLLHFFSQRCCRRAQWEIRELAEEMLALVSAVAPTIFLSAGPSCCAGACKEGKLSCGMAPQVRERIQGLKQRLWFERVSDTSCGRI